MFSWNILDQYLFTRVKARFHKWDLVGKMRESHLLCQDTNLLKTKIWCLQEAVSKAVEEYKVSKGMEEDDDVDIYFKDDKVRIC